MKIDFRGQEIEIEILSYYPGRPAKISGPPEDCYPEEYEEVEFDISTGNELLDELLMENHIDDLTELVFEAIKQEAEDAADEAAQQKYDEMMDRRMGL